MICFKKNWKNQIFSFFFFKIDADLLSSNMCLSNLCQKIQKLSLPLLWKIFEIKSLQRRAHYLNQRLNSMWTSEGPGRARGLLAGRPFFLRKKAYRCLHFEIKDCVHGSKMIYFQIYMLKTIQLLVKHISNIQSNFI